MADLLPTTLTAITFVTPFVLPYALLASTPVLEWGWFNRWYTREIVLSGYPLLAFRAWACG